MKYFALCAALACSSLLLCSGILAGCATTVPIDTGPSANAPVITWVITSAGAADQTVAANGAATIQSGSSVNISMHAKSPSGVRTLTVQGEQGWTCRKGSEAEQGDEALGPQTMNQTGQNGQAEDELTSSLVYFVNEVCQEGFSFVQGGVTLRGTASNFADQQSTGYLVLSITS